MTKRKSNSKKYRQYFFELLLLLAIVLYVFLWITFTFGHCIVCISLNYFFFWPLHCLYFFELLFLLAIVLSVFLWITFTFGHCIVCISLNYFYFWPLYWFREIQTIQWPKVKVIQRNTDNTMAKRKSNSKRPLYCLYFFELLFLLAIVLYVFL
jgi:hypothetical protein